MRHKFAQGAGQFVASDLDPYNFSMMAHAELPEPESTQRVFASLDHSQCLGRDLSSIFDT